MAHQSVTAFAERLEQDSTSWVPFRELWDAYIDFCNDEGYPAVGSRQMLGRQLREALDFKVITSRRVPDNGDEQIHGLTGLRLEVDDEG